MALPDHLQGELDFESGKFNCNTLQGGLPEHLKRTFYAEDGELAPSGYPPSRFSDSPVSDFEDGYSLYRDRLGVRGGQDQLLTFPRRGSPAPPTRRGEPVDLEAGGLTPPRAPGGARSTLARQAGGETSGESGTDRAVCLCRVAGCVQAGGW